MLQLLRIQDHVEVDFRAAQKYPIQVNFSINFNTGAGSAIRCYPFMRAAQVTPFTQLPLTYRPKRRDQVEAGRGPVKFTSISGCKTRSIVCDNPAASS
jgi:hypothetical protein